MIQGLMEFPHAEVPCGGCGHPLNRSGCEPGGPAPMVGAITICVYCAGINVLQADGTLRAAQIEEFPTQARENIRRQLKLLSAHLRGRAIV